MAERVPAERDTILSNVSGRLRRLSNTDAIHAPIKVIGDLDRPVEGGTTLRRSILEIVETGVEDHPSTISSNSAVIIGTVLEVVDEIRDYGHYLHSGKGKEREDPVDETLALGPVVLVVVQKLHATSQTSLKRVGIDSE